MEQPELLEQLELMEQLEELEELEQLELMELLEQMEQLKQLELMEQLEQLEQLELLALGELCLTTTLYVASPRDRCLGLCGAQSQGIHVYESLMFTEKPVKVPQARCS